MTIDDLIDCPESMRDYLVKFTCPMFDLTRTTDDSIPCDPFLQSMLQLLKYGRKSELAERLRAILELLRGSLQPRLVEDWILAIGVYVMSVNKSITQEEFAETVRLVWPVQIESGSLADKLLKKGRDEGRDEGIKIGEAKSLRMTIHFCQSILAIPQTPLAELETLGVDDLDKIATSLQSQVRERAT